MDKIRKMLISAEHFRKSNWILSVEILEKIIEKSPQTLKAHQMLYHIYMGKKLYNKTEEILRRALLYFPNNDYLHFLFGNLFLAQVGKASSAIHQYRKVKEKFPELELNLAVAFVKQYRRREAIQILERIMPKFRQFVPIALFLSEQYIATKDYDKAIKLLSKIEKKNPTNADIHYFLGICYDKKQNWIQAFVYFEKAKELGYSSAEFFNTLGKCCQNIGDIEKAIIYFRKSISQNIFFIKSYLDLSKLYISENDFWNAKKYLTLAKKIDPLNIWIALTSQKLVKRKKEDKKP